MRRRPSATRWRSATGRSTPRAPTATRPRSGRASRRAASTAPRSSSPRRSSPATSSRARSGRRPRTRCAPCAPTTSTCSCSTGPTTPCRWSARWPRWPSCARPAGSAISGSRTSRPGCWPRRSSTRRCSATRSSTTRSSARHGCWSSRASATCWSPPTPRSPTASVPGDATLAEIGEAHGKSAGQVALRWLLDQPNVSPIPKASSHERRVENFEVFDFALSDEQRARIDGLPKDDRQIDPDFGPDWDA